MKTPFEHRPPRELKEDSDKMLAMVLRPGFDVEAYWKKIRRELAEKEGKR